MRHGNMAAVVVTVVSAVVLSGCGGSPTPAPTPVPEPQPSVPGVTILTEAGNAVLEATATGVSVTSSVKFGFSEGPLWLPSEGPSGAWIFSDVPGSKQYKFQEGVFSVYRDPSNKANGNAVESDGSLLTCEHETRVLRRTDLNSGERTVVAALYDGKKLTSPNDVIVSRKTGIIYFTDPDYGIAAGFGHGSPSVQDKNRVYRLDPNTTEVTALVEDFVRPNGLCFSPDESKLYIADSGAAVAGGQPFDPNLPHHVRVFDVSQDGTTLSNGQVFAVVADGEGVPDGVKSDAAGNIWVATKAGVDVYSPDTTKIAHISSPMETANLAFGGPTGKDLMMASSDSVWLLTTKVVGAGLLGESGSVRQF